VDNEGVNAHIIATLPPAVAGGAEVPLFPVLDWAPAALRAVIVLCSVRSNSNFLFFLLDSLLGCCVPTYANFTGLGDLPCLRADPRRCGTSGQRGVMK